KLMLTVERDVDFGEELRDLLSDHTVLSARSMAEAVEIVMGGRVEVVVLGPSFGSEAGVRDAGSLLAADPDVSVILIANIVTNRILRAALQVGLLDVVDTPVTRRKLDEAVERPAGRAVPIVEAIAPQAEETAPEIVAEASVPVAAPGPDAVAEPALVPAPEPPAVPSAVEGVELVFGGAAIDGRDLELAASAAASSHPVMPVTAPVAEMSVEDTTVAHLSEAPDPVVEAAVPVVEAAVPELDDFLAPVAEEDIFADWDLIDPLDAWSDEVVEVSEPSPPLEAMSVIAPPPMPPPFPVEAPPMPMASPPTAVPPSGPVTIAAMPPAENLAVTVERPAARPLSGNGRVISVTAGKAGSGKTVTAVNLAAALTERLGPDRVVIIDADLQFGDVALLLQLEPAHTLVDVADAIGDLSDAQLESMLLVHESGLRVLPAPLLPLPPESTPIAGLIAVIERLRRMYDVVVVDTPPIFGPTLLSILDHSDTAAMVVDMDLPSVKNAKIAIDALRNDGYPSERLHLVVNRVNSKARLDLVELERSLGLRVSGSVPSDRIVPQSVNEGIPAVLLSPRSRVAKSFHLLAERFGPERARRAS
ncbi:MAG TPA: AAA family ATPase, partial [Acidimicrobiia bacterium]|nr:AAA family ATPase [Acidimicrobiia bacterium]